MYVPAHETYWLGQKVTAVGGITVDGSPSSSIYSGWSTFGTHCSFVDEIKLNYSLANNTLHIGLLYSCCHIRLCTVSVKCLLVNCSDTTSSSVFSHHTGIRPEGGGFVRTQRTPMDPPLLETVKRSWMNTDIWWSYIRWVVDWAVVVRW